MKKLMAVMIVGALVTSAFGGTLWSEDFEGDDSLADRGWSGATEDYAFGTITHADGTTSQGIYGGSGMEAYADLNYLHASAISVVPTDTTVGYERWQYQNLINEGQGKYDVPFFQKNFSDEQMESRATEMAAKHHDDRADSHIELNPSATVGQWAVYLKPYGTGSWALGNMRGRAVDYKLDIVRRRVDDDNTEFESRLQYAFLDDEGELEKGTLYQTTPRAHSADNYTGYGDDYMASRIEMKDTDQTIVDGLSKGTAALADFDLDGTVGSGDFSIMSSNWGNSSATIFHGDADNDGAIGSGDFSALSSAWGASAQQAVAGDGRAEVTIDDDGNIILNTLQNVNGYKIYVGFDEGVVVDGSGALVGSPNWHPDHGSYTLTEFFEGTSVFEGLLGGGMEYDDFDTGLDLDLEALADAGAELWLATDKLGEDTQYTQVIPEPMTMTLLAIGGLGALIRRRR